MLDDKKIVVVDDNDNEIEMEILFTFDNEEFNRQYVLYVNPNEDSGEVYASAYTEDGELLEISNENEWEMIESVFEAFIIQDEAA
ncbi:MAG TPA: DUF1292 domain-containing protein [Erysipelothrix sp.]|nr:DUF1292 domain-containing protein [Erysipelothrix sp.]